MRECDILILGGGPSGLSTALHLTKEFPHLTPHILILEKARYPRIKLCAGGLVIDAELILEQLGLDVSAVPHVDAERIHFDFEARGLNIRFPGRHALRIIRRDEFDHWLAKQAESRGVEIQEGVTVRKVDRYPDHVIVETDRGNFHAQVVVGADGSNGVTRRCIFPDAPVHTARVLEVLTPSQAPPNTTIQSLDAQRMSSSSYLGEMPSEAGRWGQAYFDFFPVPSHIAGYVWDFPTQVDGKLMRCWGIYDTNLLADYERPQLRDPLAREMRRFGFNLDDYPIKGHPIRWFSPENEMCKERVLLVGDAAGADPFLGEGISIALGYGALAAREIGEAFRRNQFSFRGYRRRVLSSTLGRALLVRWFIAHIAYLLHWKWFHALIWRVMKLAVILTAQILVLNWARRLK